jgi:hypothetical protein
LTYALYLQKRWQLQNARKTPIFNKKSNKPKKPLDAEAQALIDEKII